MACLGDGLDTGKGRVISATHDMCTMTSLEPRKIGIQPTNARGRLTNDQHKLHATNRTEKLLIARLGKLSTKKHSQCHKSEKTTSVGYHLIISHSENGHVL